MKETWVSDGVVFVCDIDNLKCGELYAGTNNNLNRHFLKRIVRMQATFTSENVLLT